MQSAGKLGERAWITPVKVSLSQKQKCSQIQTQTFEAISIAPPVRAWKILWFAYKDEHRQCQNICILIKTLTMLNATKLPELSNHLLMSVKLEQR